jgi:curved DNA-binding protein
MEYRDYYKTLGIERNADEKGIRKAYRDLARKYHPDVNPNNKDAESKFKEINEAYEVLSDTEKRAKYDQMGSSYQQFARNGNQGGFDWSSWATSQGANPGGSPGSGFSDSGSGDMSDFFTSFFNTRTRQQKTPIRGRDVEQPIEVTLEEAYSGTTRVLRRGEHQTKLRIPPGAREGTKIRVSGEGEAGFANGPAGDLYLIVTLKPHTIFKVRDNYIDLETDLKVDMFKAMLGGEVLVPSLSGDVKLRIAEGTQSGKILRISKRGMPQLNAPENFGDVYARVLIQEPTNLTPEERTQYEKLAALRIEKAQ